MQARTRVVAALGVAQTLGWGSTYYLPAILANAMANELGTSTAYVFVAFSLGLLVSGFLGPAAGRLIDVHGGHRVLPVSNLICAAGLAMLATSSGPWTLTASWLVIGVGMSAGLYEAAFSSLARIYGTDARGAITGITLIAGFASTVCWPLSAWMDASIGWRATCWVWVAVHLVVCLPLNLRLPRTRAAHRVESSESPPTAEASRQKLWLMAGLSFVFGAGWFGSTAMAAHLPRLLQETGASLPAAIAAAALVGPAQVVARIFEFSLIRRLHPLMSARAASLAHPVGAVVLAWLGAPAAMFFALAHGAGNGIMTIANGTLPLVLFGSKGYGLRQGLLMIPARLMQAAAPVVFDLALTRYGTAAVAVTGAFGIASFMVLMAIPTTSRYDHRS